MKLLRCIGSVGFAAALTLPTASRAADVDDVASVGESASGGLMEVELGAYAEENAANSEVKIFGEQMVRDHSKANEGLRDVATASGISVPTVMRDDHRKTVDELTKLNGAEFYQRYVSAMVDGHQKVVAAFRKQADTGDSAIDRWARETLPKLEHHLTMAQGLARAHAPDVR